MPEAPLFGLPPCQWSWAESLSLAAPRRERPERRPQRPAGVERPEGQAQEPVRLQVARVLDELLLLAVAVREAVAAEREAGKPALLNHQILIRRRWPEA